MFAKFDSIGGLLTMTDHDIFTIGSTVSVTTAVDEDISGEVMAFDSKARVLVLKLPAANNKATMCNIHTVYMSKIKNIHIAEEPESNVSPPPLPEIDISVLRKRFDKAVQERKVISSAMNSKASRIGQQLYIRLAKCMPEARWNDDAAIIVMESVAVTPPYTADFVRPLDSSDGIHHVSNDPLTPGTVEYVKRLVRPGPDVECCIDYVKKLVNRFHEGEDNRQSESSSMDLPKAPPVIDPSSEASAQR
ncbi:Anticodon-binding domain [Trinorchestia longiramus]|nr:Anticodon-binding domain [Trinorchestia longiramus]